MSDTAILEEEVRQLKLRVAALSQGPTADEQLSLSLHLAFRKAAEIKQVVEWPPAAQEAWKALYNALSDNCFGLELLKEASNG